MVKFLLLLFFFSFMPMSPTNKSPSVTQNIETYTLDLHVIPHQSCANVLVSEQIKHVNSQLPKASNKLKKNPTSDHVFKVLSLLMKSNHKFLGQPKFKDNMNMQKSQLVFFFSQKQDKCV
jgi:transposase-like protein